MNILKKFELMILSTKFDCNGFTFLVSVADHSAVAGLDRPDQASPFH